MCSHGVCTLIMRHVITELWIRPLITSKQKRKDRFLHSWRTNLEISACTPLTTCRRWTSFFLHHAAHGTRHWSWLFRNSRSAERSVAKTPPISATNHNKSGKSIRFTLCARTHNRYSKRSTLTSVLSSHGDETKRKIKRMMKINYLFIIELNTMQYHLWMWSSERSNIKSKIQEQYAFAHNLIRMKLTKPEITTTTTSFDAQI